MSTTNLIPPVQGLVQQTGESSGEWLWQMETEIHDLERNSKGTEGKVHALYQEKLMELHHIHEILEAAHQPENRGDIWGPTPLVPSPQDLLGPKMAYVPMEPEMSVVYPPRVSGSPSSQEGHNGEWGWNSNKGHGGRCSEPVGGKFGWTMDPGRAGLI